MKINIINVRCSTYVEIPMGSPGSRGPPDSRRMDSLQAQPGPCGGGPFCTNTQTQDRTLPTLCQDRLTFLR